MYKSAVGSVHIPETVIQVGWWLMMDHGLLSSLLYHGKNSNDILTEYD